MQPSNCIIIQLSLFARIGEEWQRERNKPDIVERCMQSLFQERISSQYTGLHSQLALSLSLARALSLSLILTLPLIFLSPTTSLYASLSVLPFL